MPTTPSAKTKSPRGSSGPDVPPEAEVVGNEEDLKTTVPVSESPDTLVPPVPPVSESEPGDAVAAEDSGNGEERTPFVPPTPILSETDRKLATRMTRAIAEHLGLSGRTRSVRV